MISTKKLRQFNIANQLIDMLYFRFFVIFFISSVITGCSVGSNPMPLGMTIEPNMVGNKTPSQLTIRNLQYRKFNKSFYELTDAVEEMHRSQSIIDNCIISLPKFKINDGINNNTSEKINLIVNSESGKSNKCRLQINQKIYFIDYQIQPSDKVIKLESNENYENNDIFWMNGFSRTAKINFGSSLVRIQIFNAHYQLFDEYLYSYVFKKLAETSFANTLVLDPSNID